MSITGEALAGTFECYFTPYKAVRPLPIYTYISVYRCIENRWTFTGIFGVATAQLAHYPFNSPEGMISCTRASGAAQLRK